MRGTASSPRMTPRTNTPFAYAPQVEWMTLDQIIDLEMERIEETTKNKIELYKSLKAKWDKELEETKKETGIGYDTGGAI
jgi:hypothetical protein